LGTGDIRKSLRDARLPNTMNLRSPTYKTYHFRLRGEPQDPDYPILCTRSLIQVWIFRSMSLRLSGIPPGARTRSRIIRRTFEKSTGVHTAHSMCQAEADVSKGGSQRCPLLRSAITGTPERLQHRSDITTGCNRSRGLELGCNLGVEHYNNWGLYYRRGTYTTKENWGNNVEGLHYN